MRKLSTTFVCFDRWHGVARDGRLVAPEEALVVVTRRSGSGLTVGGYGLREGYQEAVHWTHHVHRGDLIFFRGHGATGGGYVHEARRSAVEVADFIRDHIGAPSFEDGLDLFTRREWEELWGEKGGTVEIEISARAQARHALAYIRERGFAYFARAQARERLFVELCRLEAELYETDKAIVGFYWLNGDLYVHMDKNEIYIGTADFWRSEQMTEVRKDFPEKLRTRWFGSE